MRSCNEVQCLLITKNFYIFGGLMNRRLLQIGRSICLLLLSGLVAACSSVVASSPGSTIKHTYQANVTVLAQEPAARIQISVQDDGKPADFSDGKSILHAHLSSTIFQAIWRLTKC